MICILETSSAHLREILRSACSQLSPTLVFASATAARRALADNPRCVLIVGGAPLDDAAAEVLELAAGSGIPSFACVGTAELGRALQLGAIDTCARSAEAIERFVPQLLGRLPTVPRSVAQPAPRNLPPLAAARGERRARQLIAIGASTGGPEAISSLLSRLPPQLPGIVVVQHMPGSQTGAFADRLDAESAWEVREARDGDSLERGVALIAPGGLHVRLEPGGLHLHVSATGPASRHVPSVDLFFDSVARELGASALAILLTGMGDDGAQGMLALRRAGAYTLAQSEATCAVFGMPRRAIELDAACEVLALLDMPERVAALCTP